MCASRSLVQPLRERSRDAGMLEWLEWLETWQTLEVT